MTEEIDEKAKEAWTKFRDKVLVEMVFNTNEYDTWTSSRLRDHSEFIVTMMGYAYDIGWNDRATLGLAEDGPDQDERR
jgi:hypothetical protein